MLTATPRVEVLSGRDVSTTDRHRKVFLKSFDQAKHGQCSDHQSTAVIRSPLTSGWTYQEDPYTQRLDRSQQAEMAHGALYLYLLIVARAESRSFIANPSASNVRDGLPQISSSFAKCNISCKENHECGFRRSLKRKRCDVRAQIPRLTYVGFSRATSNACR